MPPTPAPQKSTIDEVEELAHKMHSLDIGDVAYLGCYTCLVCLAPAAAQAWTPRCAHQQDQGPPQYPPGNHTNVPQGDMLCFFCGLPHLICNCPTTAEYIRTGHMMQENDYFLNTDHSCIQCNGNGTIQQAINEHYSMALAATSTPATGTNLRLTSFSVNMSSRTTQSLSQLKRLKMKMNWWQPASARAKAPAPAPSAKDKAPALPPTLPVNRAKCAPEPPKPIENQLAQKTPAYTYKSKAASPEATQRIYQHLLNMVVPNLTISNLLAISPDLRHEAVDHCHTQHIPSPPSAMSANAIASALASAPLQVEHATPLHELHVMLNGVHSELGFLDEGSEIVVIREDTWKKTGAPHNQQIRMRMQTANRGSRDMDECVEMLEIEVGGIKMWAHAYVMPHAPYRLLLG
ncbi:hypothetical protein DFH29DRAFT_881918 [Suillus ampliporus]|nr:hypothetical protein DFH29DRAFT_881918 [Suillus ampliporus]